VRDLEKALAALAELLAGSALELDALPSPHFDLEAVWKVTDPRQGASMQAALETTCQQLAAFHGRLAGELEDRANLIRLMALLSDRQAFAVNAAKADLVVGVPRTWAAILHVLM
jgi:hypothetical protein